MPPNNPQSSKELEDWGIEFVEESIPDKVKDSEVMTWVKDTYPDLTPAQIEWLDEFFEEKGEL